MQGVGVDDYVQACRTEEASGERERVDVRITSTKLASQLSVGHRLDSLCRVAPKPRLALEAAEQRAVYTSLLEPRLGPRITTRQSAQHRSVAARAPDARPLHAKSQN